MVKISIIIVSYNVKYFLEQCLFSLKKSIRQWSAADSRCTSEVFVVDNNSSDDSIPYLASRFPFVQFISNNENKGFATANNQALQLVTGQFILFLNPDTILPENFFTKCLSHMDTHQKAGALGVQMIDGRGNFLKESKRGFPSTWTAFCKLSGLTALFPRSKIFAKYYLGHLEQDRNHEVEALSGACMFIRKEALDNLGGFDERFFMYAEDIDLSYRIVQSGYTNYYCADVSIIHFKGESTIKDIRYVKLFYKAMVQFVQKHYPGRKGILYTKFLKMAIALRGLFAAGHLPLAARKGNSGSAKRRIFLEGDMRSIEEVKAALQHADGIHIVQSTNDNEEILICEGDQFSFKDIIKRMSISPAKTYKIHAFQSSSIVGSNDSRSMGEVIVLTGIKK